MREEIGVSNDNPESPDWDRTSDIPRGGFLEKCEQSHVFPKITTPHSKHKMYFSLSLKIKNLHSKHKMYFSLSLKIKNLHSKHKMYFSLSLKIKTLHSKHKMYFSLSLKIKTSQQTQNVLLTVTKVLHYFLILVLASAINTPRPPPPKRSKETAMKI